MIKSIEDKINKLRYETYDNIKSIELAHIPYAYYLKYENIEKYTIDGKIYDFSEQLRDITNTMHIFLAHNLPFTFHTRNYKTYKTPVQDLIKTGEMIPFLLFANGKFIKWSDIEIVRDYRYSYVVVNNIEYDIEKDSLICVLMPFELKYNEGSTIEYINNDALYFDIDGKFTTFKNKAYTSVEILDKNTTIRGINGGLGFRFKIRYEDSNELQDPDELAYQLEGQGLTQDLTSIVSYIVIYNEDGSSYKVQAEIANNFQINTKKYGQLGFIENCLVFKNGLLNIDIRDQLKRDELNFIESEDTKIYIKIFKYDNSQVSHDLVFKIPNTIYTKYLVEENSEILDPIKNKNFNFNFNKRRSYAYNLNKAFEYIANYDFNLFNDIIKSQSKIISFSYTGQKIKTLTKDNYFNIPKLLDEKLNTSSCIIFVNNLIYKYYHMSEDTPMYFKMYIPENYLNDSDKVEIVHFKNIDNSILELSLDKDNSIELLNTDLNNYEIYIDGIEDQFYELDNKYFKTKIDFSFTKNNNLYHIDIDEKYYNKNLNIVSCNRFAYLHYHIPEDCLGVALDLRNDFLYCRNKNQYMIFLNGKLIEPEYYELKLPEKDSPINDMSVYFSIPLYKRSTLSIFYVPREFTRITQNTIDEEGYISVDLNNLNYPLDNDGYLYFVNGKKVFTQDILNINKNTVKLNIDMESTHNLTILKHIDEVPDLSSVFLNTTLWDNFLSSLNDEERDKLFNISKVIQSNIETDIYEETISKEQLLYELVAQYYLENELTNAGDFEYSLDDSILDDNDVDSEGTNIIRLVDTNKEDKADIYGIDKEE